MLESIDSGNASPNYNLERQDTIESYDLNISENWKQLLAKYKDDPGNLNHIKDLFRAIEDNQLRIDKKLAQLNGAQLITVEDLLRYSEIINERDTKLQKDIYTTATKDKPVNAFFNLKEYETSAYIDDIIATIFETDPSIFMGSQASKYAPNDETIKAKISKIQTKIDKNVLLNLAKSQPGNILRLIDFYAQQPYCKEIIAKAKEFYEEEDIIHPYTELFITHRFSYDIYQYLSLHTVSLDIGKQTHVITEKHVSFLSGLCQLADKRFSEKPSDYSLTQTDIDNLLVQYQKHLNDYMTAHKEDVTMKKNTMVFFLRNDDKNDISTLKKQKDERFRLLQKRYTDVIDYSTNAGSREHKGSKSAGEFFNEQVENFIQDKILNNDNPQYLRIFIGLHGGPDGSAKSDQGVINKEEFEQLRNITSGIDQKQKNDFLKKHGKSLTSYISIDVTSCFSGAKFDDKKNELGNITASSSLNPSTTGYSNAFFEAYKKDIDGKYHADFDGDGDVSMAEAKIYQMLHYDDSIIKTTFENKDGQQIDISYVELAEQEGIV